jgi:pectate lyase
MAASVAGACGGSEAENPPSGSSVAPPTGGTRSVGGFVGSGGTTGSGGVTPKGGSTPGGGTVSAGGMAPNGGASGAVNAAAGATSEGGAGAVSGGTSSGGGVSNSGASSGGAVSAGSAGKASTGGAATGGAGGASGPTGETKLDGLIGFATVSGYGVATTIGAGNAPVVRVANFADFVAAVKDHTPRIVEVSGTISGSGVEMVDVGSNKTILGIGANATISGFGLDLNGWTEAQVAEFDRDTCGPGDIDAFPRVSNVIVRNLNFTSVPDDAINIQCYSHHIWIDHNTFQPGYDGSVDVKRGSDLVTVSWNRFASTDKTMLLGHSEDNGEQDRDFLRATYHHNWFDNTATRTPRVRFGYAHVFNNYLNSSDYFLGLGIEAKIYAEGNYVEKAKTLTQTFTESTGYHLTWAASNQYDRATITRANDSGSSMSEWLDADGSVQKPSEYQYSVDAASAVATSVKAGAGVGKH